jgi:uncharacterized protein YcaQ
MRRRVRLSAGEARRIALAAQGMHRERPACVPDARHFRRAMQALQVLQLDYVNVLVPAHYLVLWSRLGAYERLHGAMGARGIDRAERCLAAARTPSRNL